MGSAAGSGWNWSMERPGLRGGFRGGKVV